MQIEFRCRGCLLSSDQRALMEDRLGRLGKYIGEPERAEVFFERTTTTSSGEQVRAELTMVRARTVLRSHATAIEETAAFDRAEQKLKRQLEALKGRLVGRSHPHHRTDKAVDPESLSEGFAIAKTKTFELEELDPETAAFRMELLSHSFYLFQNALTQRSAVVYRRGDGTIGLIDQNEPVDS
ncbi:MAG: ribosome hibernation promotion factor [Ferrimicrobium sp.]